MIDTSIHRPTAVTVNEDDGFVWLTVQTDRGYADIHFADEYEMRSFVLAVLKAAAKPGTSVVCERTGGREESAPLSAPSGGLTA